MFYEIKLIVEKEYKKGELKKVKEHFITDVGLFCEAEAKGIEEYVDKCDIFAIVRSKIREIVNRKEEDKPFFKATIVDIFTNDDGTEKELTYPVLVCAKDITEADRLMKDYIAQGLNDMRLKEIKETKIIDVL